MSYRCKIHADWSNEYLYIYFRRNLGEGRIEIAYPSGSEWILEEVREGEYIDRSKVLKIPRSMRNSFIKAVHEFEKPVVDATEQELKATKYHLEDMRELVFKEK